MRLAGFLLFAALFAMAAAPAAQADPAFEVTAEPDRVAPGEEAVFTVKVTTGAEAERFGLRFGGLFGHQGRPVWPLLTVASAATHEGAGEFDSAPGPSPGAAPPCSRFDFPVTRGFAYEGSTWAWLELPAHSTSRVRMVAMADAAAPRVGERYGISVRTFNSDTQHSGGTLDSPGPVPAPTLPPADGRRGVWLTGTLEPAAIPLRTAPCEPLPSNSGPVTFRGRTDPPLPGQTVTIEGGSRSASAPAAIGTAVVGDGGTFTFGPWTPPAPGDYELRAVYRSQQAEFADDHMEPALGFRYEPVVPTPAPSIARSARVRRGVALVRLTCAAPCDGTLRLRRGRAALGRRAFSKAASGPQTVRVRLSRRWRRAMVRRGRLAVRAEIVRAGEAGPSVRLVLRRR